MKDIEDIEDCVERKQPVLVGTISIETSEYLSGLLQQKNIDHKVLNAKHHEHEAQIVSEAGRPGRVTIATNMAGRGTDIVLGGNFDSELKQAETDKEELSEVEEVEEKVELEKVTHNPEAEPQKEMKLYGQKREMTTADRVFSRISNIKNK